MLCTPIIAKSAYRVKKREVGLMPVMERQYDIFL